MPVASHQVVQPQEQETLQVRLEPAQAVFSDLFLLDKVDELSGLDPWVERTALALGQKILNRNHQVLHGLYYALMPRRSYSDFPTYLDDLANQEPAAWIDNLFESYEAMSAGESDLEPVSREALLADFDAYLEYLYQRFESEYIDIEVERQAHEWLRHPEQMQQDALAHLRFMWQEHLEAAWQQSLPLLEDSVRSFQQVEWPEGSIVEIAQWAAGQELKDWDRKMLSKADRVVLVPSTHVGPYTVSLKADEVLWLIFGARIAHGATVQSPALSRSQLLMRLNALADANRLHILEMLREQGEMCAQEIIEAIELSQSSASRHLRQLSATGYLLERRKESAKCYRLNPDQSGETVAALAEFLGVES